MSKRRNRPQGTPQDADDSQLDDVADDGEEGCEEDAEVSQAIPAPAPTAVAGPTKLDVETLHAVPVATNSTRLLAVLNTAAARAERDRSFDVAGALHVIAHRLTEVRAALPGAREAAAMLRDSETLVARLSTLADLL